VLHRAHLLSAWLQGASYGCGLEQVAEWRALRERLGLPDDARGDAAAEAAAAQQGLTAAQLASLVRRCAQRYEAKRTDPGARSRACSSSAEEIVCSG